MLEANTVTFMDKTLVGLLTIPHLCACPDIHELFTAVAKSILDILFPFLSISVVLVAVTEAPGPELSKILKS